MRQNKIRKIWAEGGAVVNGWLQIPSSIAAEAMAHAGYDSVTIDMQHGPVDYVTAVPMLQAISTTDTVPLARVPWNEPGIIMKMLDVGCYGIICPMINSRAEAEQFVGACRYWPNGYRSHGPNRVTYYAGDDYGAHADEEILTIAMIETQQALDNLDAILSTPQLDAIYIGPADLSRTLGVGPAVHYRRPPLSDAVAQILAAAQKHGVMPGAHTGSSDDARLLLDMGFKFVTVGSDKSFVDAGAKGVVTAVKQGTATAKADGTSSY